MKVVFCIFFCVFLLASVSFAGETIEGKEVYPKDKTVATASYVKGAFDVLSEKIKMLDNFAGIENTIVTTTPTGGLVATAITDKDEDTKKYIDGIYVKDSSVRITRSNIKIPEGSADANPTVAIWLE